MQKKYRFYQTRRARWSRVIFQQAQGAVGQLSFCNHEVFEQRLTVLQARVCVSSSSSSIQSSFQQCFKVLQPRVRISPSFSSISTTNSRFAIFQQRVKVLQPRSHVSPSASLAAFQTTSSHLRAAFQGEYFALQ